MSSRSSIAVCFLPCVVLVALLSGCSGGTATAPTTSTPVTTPPATGASGIYVGNSTGLNQYQVLQFARTASGSVAPVATLNLPAGFTITCLATDPTGQIYAGGYTQTAGVYQFQVLVYAAGASGTATPLRTIVGSGTSFANVLGITTDASGQLYLSTFPTAIVIFAAGANGTATPTRIIGGSATRLSSLVYGLAADSAGTIYAANVNSPSVVEFSATANGNVAPMRVITGTNTGLDHLYGADVDSSGNLYVSTVTQIPGISTATTIQQFAPAADGNVAPVRSIGGSNTGLNAFGSALRVDSTGTVFIAIDGAAANKPFVSTFAATANGNVTPVSTFTSSAWLGPAYFGIAIH